MSEFVRTYCRVRPSDGAKECLDVYSSNSLKVNVNANWSNPKAYVYDKVFAQTSTQDDIFNTVGCRIVEGCVEGYNGTIFAYGQTGSGKTHTMLGPSDPSQQSGVDVGLIPRVAKQLFSLLDQCLLDKGPERFSYTVTCSFVQLYNEEFFDLLDPTVGKLGMRFAGKKVELLGLTEMRSQSIEDVMAVVRRGWANRKVAETAMNRESSRSHAIFIVDVHMEEMTGSLVTSRRSRLNLVDLAGSERQASTSASGSRFKEATHINLSLTVLGRVIRILETKSRQQNAEVVPYRDSKLTMLLRDSLGGNSRTAVIVTVHPNREYIGDTLSTLNFAQSCGSIRNKAVVNRRLSADSALAFQAEITRLHKLLSEKDEEHANAMASLHEQLHNQQSEITAQHKEKAMLRLEMDMLEAKSALAKAHDMVEETSLHSKEAYFVEKLSERFEAPFSAENLHKIELLTKLEQVTFDNAVLNRQLEEAQDSLNAVSKKLVGAIVAPRRRRESMMMTRSCHSNTSIHSNRRIDDDGGRVAAGFDSSRTVVDANDSISILDSTPKHEMSNEERRQRRQTRFNTPGRDTSAFVPVLNFELDENDEYRISQNAPPPLAAQSSPSEDELRQLNEEMLRLEVDNNNLRQNVRERDETISGLETMQKAREARKLELESQYQEKIDSLQSDIERERDERSRIAEKLSEKEKLMVNIAARVDEYKSAVRAADELTNKQTSLAVETRIRCEELEADLAKERMRNSELADELDKTRVELQESVEKHESEQCAQLRRVIEEQRRRYEELQTETKLREDAVKKSAEASELRTSSLMDRLTAVEEVADDFRSRYQTVLDEFNALREKSNDDINNQRKRYEAQCSAKNEQIELLVDLKDQLLRQREEDKRTHCASMRTFQDKLTGYLEELSKQEEALEQSNYQLEEYEEKLASVNYGDVMELKLTIVELNQELSAKTKELEVYRDMHKSDSHTIRELAGHHNPKQKISYVDNVREEFERLKVENGELKRRNYELERGNLDALRRDRSRATSTSRHQATPLKAAPPPRVDNSPMRTPRAKSSNRRAPPTPIRVSNTVIAAGSTASPVLRSRSRLRAPPKL